MSTSVRARSVSQTAELFASPTVTHETHSVSLFGDACLELAHTLAEYFDSLRCGSPWHERKLRTHLTRFVSKATKLLGVLDGRLIDVAALRSFVECLRANVLLPVPENKPRCTLVCCFERPQLQMTPYETYLLSVQSIMNTAVIILNECKQVCFNIR